MKVETPTPVEVNSYGCHFFKMSDLPDIEGFDIEFTKKEDTKPLALMSGSSLHYHYWLCETEEILYHHVSPCGKLEFDVTSSCEVVETMFGQYRVVYHNLMDCLWETKEEAFECVRKLFGVIFWAHRNNIKVSFISSRK